MKLRAAGRQLGHLCPHHRDTAPTPLLVGADEAELHESLRAGRRQASGSVPLTWRRGNAVHCPRCGSRWDGVPALRMLMMLIDAAAT